MSIGFKIRSLLLLLGICCIVTALSISHSLTRNNLLDRETEVLQENLSAKENLVKQFISDKKLLTQARDFHKNGAAALKFIDNFRNIGINILTYEGQQLNFWSSVKSLPQNIKNIREGNSLIQFRNGYYEAIKVSEADFTILFLIAVKDQFAIENQYLKNRLLPDLSPSGVLDIAPFTDSPEAVRNINSLDGRFLFSVKLIADSTNNIFSTAEVWLWIFGIFFICMFFNSFCSLLAKKGYLFAGTSILTLFFLAFRLSDLEFGWFNHQFNLEIFNPKIYAESFFMPSLGDFLLNAISVTWVILFIYFNFKKHSLKGRIAQSKAAAVGFHLLLLALFTAIAYLTDETFFGLIYNSRIGFDINIINLDWVSWVCVLLLCLAWFNIYLCAIIFVKLAQPFNLTTRERLVVFLAAFVGYGIYRACIADFTGYFIVYGLLLFLLAYNVIVQERIFSVLVFAASIFCMATITSVKYIKFTDIKERSLRSNIAQKLQTADDPKVINAIDIFERGIALDDFVKNYFTVPGANRQTILQNYIEKKYLDGFISRFEINMYAYNMADSAISPSERQPLEYFQGLVRTGALKTPESNYFYRINDTFGYQNYFGIIPVFNGPSILGTLVIELKSQPYNYNLRFPDLLIDGKIKSESDYSDYSFAFYNNNNLVNQSGEFSYKLNNTEFHVPVGSIQFINTTDPDFSHLVYAPTASKVIVVSREKIAYVTRLAALSFFFLIFTVFSFLVYLLISLSRGLENSAFGWFSINKYLMINANKILYKTRIQVSIILAVVVTLLVVGWTTFYYISEEYREQQGTLIKDKIRKIQLSYERQLAKTGKIELGEQSDVKFNQFADVNDAFLNLYSINGDLILTSLPKIYETGIIGRKMGSKAYISLHQLKVSEFINPSEKIGDFKYAAAYVPIRNAENKTIAYLGSPYYGNEEDYDNKIGLFINTLINIYALVFVAIGILAVFLANQITNPLTFIQESIRQTKLGQRNQPIHWSRHDEIGSLIREYNKMIAALEQSAVKLARSEREHAWREMAKQVAHEIKNPLTPLKLGVQLLERSWKENDPNFEKKFENFNRSFIEQIDSLANIASEFSNFAKMPDTKLEKVELLPIVKQAKEVFRYAENADIAILNKMDKEPVVLGDKDQLLRTFNNLLKNAIEAMPEGKGSTIKILIHESQTHIVVSIEDNGKGITKDQQEKIFAPNFTTKSSGTGLGLAFVKQAVENAGGEVSFISEEQMGTTFFLSFPRIDG